MSSLREAAEEYLALRRALGFKLRQLLSDALDGDGAVVQRHGRW
jgi:hypothetical protein